MREAKLICCGRLPMASTNSSEQLHEGDLSSSVEALEAGSFPSTISLSSYLCTELYELSLGGTEDDMICLVPGRLGLSVSARIESQHMPRPE